MPMHKIEGKFPLGKLVWTRGVNDRVADDLEFAKFVTDSIQRHASGDWGSLDAEDKGTNDDALAHGGRLFSAYEHETYGKLWVITEQDRSATTALFPSEY